MGGKPFLYHIPKVMTNYIFFSRVSDKQRLREWSPCHIRRLRLKKPHVSAPSSLFTQHGWLHRLASLISLPVTSLSASLTLFFSSLCQSLQQLEYCCCLFCPFLSAVNGMKKGSWHCSLLSIQNLYQLGWGQERRGEERQRRTEMFLSCIIFQHLFLQ